jgi:hypothetical protein
MVAGRHVSMRWHCFVPFAETLLKKCCDFEIASKVPKTGDIDQGSSQSMEAEGIRRRISDGYNQTFAAILKNYR